MACCQRHQAFCLVSLLNLSTARKTSWMDFKPSTENHCENISANKYCDHWGIVNKKPSEATKEMHPENFAPPLLQWVGGSGLQQNHYPLRVSCCSSAYTFLKFFTKLLSRMVDYPSKKCESQDKQKWTSSRITSATEVHMTSTDVSATDMYQCWILNLKYWKKQSDTNFHKYIQVKSKCEDEAFHDWSFSNSCTLFFFLKRTTTQHTPPTHPHSREKRTVSLVNQTILFFSHLSTGKRAEAKPCKIKYINALHHNSQWIAQRSFYQVVVHGMLPTSPSLLLSVSSQPFNGQKNILNGFQAIHRKPLWKHLCK